MLQKSIMKQGIIFFCLVIASVSGNKMIINDRQQENSLGRLKHDARELVEMCFTNNSNPVMISEDLLDDNWNPGENSLIVINRKFNKHITGFLPTYPTYVLSFKSIDNLKPVIDNLQRSKFWNTGSPFLMVGTGSRCSNTKKVLEFMWNRDSLSVYYLCENKNSSVIYTLNSYASYAPAPWKLIEKFGDSDKKLTLFRLGYIKGTLNIEYLSSVLKIITRSLFSDPQICKSITFDKTDHLEDYTRETTISIVTKKTDSLTGISEIINNEQFVIGTSLLLIMFTIVMVIIIRDDIGLAVMKMARLVTGMAIETPLNRLAIKLIFFFGFLFAFLIVPDCLGNITAMLMNSPKRNVDSLKDLYENKFMDTI
ncbi:uncharacterized protein LOC123270658 [Cotesia glomerata]|uniref:uncharacterized protein LOC123270658 n=1 Tax=Cotesia glomerata TaxID=32391 RepID=UPI001D0174C1|nr:uncharacterized protein LOC123270658 [Cotesia glomerata]